VADPGEVMAAAANVYFNSANTLKKQATKISEIIDNIINAPGENITQKINNLNKMKNDLETSKNIGIIDRDSNATQDKIDKKIMELKELLQTIKKGISEPTLNFSKNEISKIVDYLKNKDLPNDIEVTFDNNKIKVNKDNIEYIKTLVDDTIKEYIEEAAEKKKVGAAREKKP